SLRIFRPRAAVEGKRFAPMPTDFRAELVLQNGRKQKVEFYHGSGYLSQSTRAVNIPADAREMTVYDFAGKSRKVDFSALAQSNK
ncbi:MAG TPA: hypothetical protein VFT90_00660, partial [Chryseosolibacter sp.]|nr:hypothetical protein [Chryseosolibacter sp.]